DPDREGEAISWHVLEALKEKHALKTHAVERVVFNAITKQAVLDAMKHPRKIDGALVDAYLARRALDYLVGYPLSPAPWRKHPRRGRGVQGGIGERRVHGGQRRGQASQAQSAGALHHLDAAAGSKPQARLCARAHHARRAAALRRRRGRRRDHRPHYIYAHRR